MGLVDLVRAGVVTNRRKAIDRGKSVFTFAMGQKAMYDYLDDNPSVASRPVDYVNHPRIIAQNDNVMSINATIEIDLTGACNSEHMLGHQYSASGGQLDFVRGAYASKGGKSIIATRSTAAGGKISRIVPRLEGPVTTPRIDTHYVVTEFGFRKPQGPILDRARQGADRPRPSEVPRGADRCRQKAPTCSKSECCYDQLPKRILGRPSRLRGKRG
jgi:itaconate CoA-transferase